MSSSSQNNLDPTCIPKFTNKLIIPPVYSPTIVEDPVTGAISHEYSISMAEFQAQILPPGFPMTKVWGYEGLVEDSDHCEPYKFKSTPGATFNAIRGIPIVVTWINEIKKQHLFAVDPTIHWANPNSMSMDPPMPWPSFPPGFKKAQYPVPLVTHLHGGENPSIYDGHPDAWTTFNGETGPAYVTNRYIYPNTKESTTLWYHDHSLGITRLNVYAGLAGFYIIRDPNQLLDNKSTTVLPTGKYEIPLVIQDRSFNCDGSLNFTNKGDNPDIHPYWAPEFFGNTILVNGKAWPSLNVEKHQYRFRILNGSNARFYNIRLSNNQSFIQIGTDGGYLPVPVTLTSLLIAPGERADIIIDFSELNEGTSIVMENTANAPYPDGNPANPKTVGQIMQFKVHGCHKSERCNPLPKLLNSIPKLTPNQSTRILTLNEVPGPSGPVQVLLNGQSWNGDITELPKVGSTEIWEFVNLTMDTHPIHLHLVQFQILNRQNFDVDAYSKDWETLNYPLPLERPTVTLSPTPFLSGESIAPDLNELGWKDTIRANPGQVTRIVVRFAPQDANPCQALPGVNLYSFDPTSGPGYVWHCHILDHEDNEMMRPYQLTT